MKDITIKLTPGEANAVVEALQAIYRNDNFSLMSGSLHDVVMQIREKQWDQEKKGAAPGPNFTYDGTGEYKMLYLDGAHVGYVLSLGGEGYQCYVGSYPQEELVGGSRSERVAKRTLEAAVLERMNK